jgi:CPA2 family monovalent cation:H+ antiporter-2
VFYAIEPVQAWIRSHSKRAPTLERSDDPLAELPMTVDRSRITGHVILVGYGRVGRCIGKALTERGVATVVVEQNRELVESLRERGMPAVSGDASEPAVLVQAHIARAQMLVIATPDAFRARQMIEIARTLNPGVGTVVRSHSDEEAALLRKEKAGKVFVGEEELALGMTRHVLERVTGGMDTRPEVEERIG